MSMSDDMTKRMLIADLRTILSSYRDKCLRCRIDDEENSLHYEYLSAVIFLSIFAL